MQATVVQVESGKITVIVRRGFRREVLDRHHNDLRVGDHIEVKRQRNNPYLIRVVSVWLPDGAT